MEDIKVHLVRSQSDPKKIYTVQIMSDGFGICDCIFYQFKGYFSGKCKHIDFIADKHYKRKKK